MNHILPSKHLRLFLIIFFLPFTGMFSGCLHPVPGLQHDKPALIQSEIKTLKKKKDNILEAYNNFLLSSIAMSQGQFKKARKYLSNAIENDRKSPYLHRKMATLLLMLKDYKNALAHALICIDFNPEDIRNRMLLADIYTRMDNDNSAIKQYYKILSLEPENQRVILLLTTLLIRKNDFTKALDYLERLKELNPNLIIAHYYHGRVNLEIGHYKKAEGSFLKALELNKKLEPALFDLGSLYQKTDRHADAVDIYEKLLGFYSENIAARERLVNLYFKLGLKEKAEDHMNEIKKQTKPGEPMRQSIGLIYLRQGKLHESIQELNMIVSAWPDDHKSRYYLAIAYEESDDIENAIEHFKMVEPMSKYFCDAQIHIAYLLDKQNKSDEAIANLKKAITIKRDKIQLYLMLSSIYETKKQYKNAIEVIRNGLKQDDKDIDLIFRLGVLLDKSGDRASCIEQMKIILEIKPDHADSLNYIGYSYAEQGMKLDEALGMIQKAMKLKPNSGYIIDSLGWVYFQKGMYNKAIQHLEKAVKLTPNDPMINEHLGDANFKMKKYKDALEYYKKSLSLKHPDQNKLNKKITEVKRLLKEKAE